MCRGSMGAEDGEVDTHADNNKPFKLMTSRILGPSVMTEVMKRRGERQNTRYLDGNGVG